MSKPTLRFGVSYDFRNPADSGVSDQYPVFRDSRTGAMA